MKQLENWWLSLEAGDTFPQEPGSVIRCLFIRAIRDSEGPITPLDLPVEFDAVIALAAKIGKRLVEKTKHSRLLQTPGGIPLLLHLRFSW